MTAKQWGAKAGNVQREENDLNIKRIETLRMGPKAEVKCDFFSSSDTLLLLSFKDQHLV